MDRRAFIGAFAGGLVIAHSAAEAQLTSEKVSRIGVLSPFTPADAARWHEALRQGLRERGWIEGKNISIEYRYADGHLDRLPALATELVRLKVDVIVTSVMDDTLPAKEATLSIPIVMAAGVDPVLMGMAGSLARPGGNVTGLAGITPELAGKRLELLKEMVPNLSRVAVMWNPGSRGSTINWQELQLPARSLGLELHSLETRNPSDLDRAFADAGRARVGALAIMPDPLFAGNLRRIADLAIRSRLPAVFHLREFVVSGGLVAYGPDRADLFRRAATYVDKILKGAKPANLPIERPTKFELVINLKTMKALGISIPQSVLLRADEVIQ
jgi:putative tryptophan/tyrosine transport system substrate-binding protein